MSASTPEKVGNDRIVWVDCEMTGLSIQSDALVEIAAIVTDGELNELDGGLSIVIAPSDLSVLDHMDPVVVGMHTASGLLPLIPQGVTLTDAAEQVLSYIRQHVPEARKAPLGGSSVYVDRMFLARDMPEVDAWLHYRLVDVSTVKELARRWFPRAYFNAPAKTGNHRALADIRESIAELRYYRELVFVEGQGPTTSAAKQAAAGHVVAHH